MNAAHQAGFDEVYVQKEPIAAAFEYERRISGEEIAFIADFGGGTSDFIIMRLGPDHVDKTDRSSDILGVVGVFVDARLPVQDLIDAHLKTRGQGASGRLNYDWPFVARAI